VVVLYVTKEYEFNLDGTFAGPSQTVIINGQ